MRACVCEYIHSKNMHIYIYKEREREREREREISWISVELCVV